MEEEKQPFPLERGLVVSRIAGSVHQALTSEPLSFDEVGRVLEIIAALVNPAVKE